MAWWEAYEAMVPIIDTELRRQEAQLWGVLLTTHPGLMMEEGLIVEGIYTSQACQSRMLPAIPGHLCEVCLDAPAIQLLPAPWGGEMGVCAVCVAQEHTRP